MSGRLLHICLFVGAAGISAVASAQDFAPFTPESRKLFGAVPGYASTFGIAFDSTTVNGGVTTHHNYRTVWDTLTTTSCFFWVGNECLKQDRPTWAGARVEADASGAHTFFNVWNDPIHLDFSSIGGSETIIYEDATQRFKLAYDGEALGQILEQSEMVRTWHIVHEELDGTPINSVLNNALVRVGVNVGLASYFRIDSFPQVLRPVELVGQMEPMIGLHTLTPALLHDHQVGDVIQKHYYSNYYTGPPWYDFNVYIKTTILSRSETPDEVTYQVERVNYNVDSGTVETDTVMEFYSRTVGIPIPFDRFDGTQPSLGMQTYCGIPLWTYRTYLNTGLGYCPQENCWGMGDTNGPPAQGGSAEVAGLGTYSAEAYLVSPEGFTRTEEIVYFKKNGTECMEEVIMGLPEQYSAMPSFTLGPNPTDGVLKLTSAIACLGAHVFNLQGRMALTNFNPAQGTLDLSALANGCYMLRLSFANGTEATRLVVVSHR